jgi:hypothetical protein
MFGRLFGSKIEEPPKPKDNLGMDDLPKAYGLYNIIKNSRLSKEEKQEQFKKILDENKELLSLKTTKEMHDGNIIHILAFGEQPNGCLDPPYLTKGYIQSFVDYLHDNPEIVNHIKEINGHALTDLDKNGKTPLFYANVCHNAKMIKILKPLRSRVGGTMRKAHKIKRNKKNRSSKRRTNKKLK